MKRCAVLLALLCAGSPALAAGEAAGFAGTYENKGPYQQTVKITPAGKDRFRGAFSVTTRGCIGSITLTGRATGKDTLFFNGDCKINVSYAPDRSSIKVTHDYCGHSGPSCDFNGVIKRAGR